MKNITKLLKNINDEIFEILLFLKEKLFIDAFNKLKTHQNYLMNLFFVLFAY